MKSSRLIIYTLICVFCVDEDDDGSQSGLDRRNTIHFHFHYFFSKESRYEHDKLTNRAFTLYFQKYTCIINFFYRGFPSQQYKLNSKMMTIYLKI